MKFKNLLILTSSILLLSGCGDIASNSSSITTTSSGDSITEATSNVTSNEEDDDTSSESERTIDVDTSTLKETYGEFSISDGELSSDGTTYIIAVGESKKTVTLSGYFLGNIVIRNVDELTSFKGVTLKLDNACIVSTSGSSIYYELESKNVEISPKNETKNKIINLGNNDGDNGIYSLNNIEIDGKGELEIITSVGHAIKAEEDIKLYGSTTVKIDSGHDAFHGKNFLANDGEDEPSNFTGTVTISYALSQGFDFTTKKFKGTIDITSGTFYVSNCESVFKTDKTLTIAGVVISSDITHTPVVKGDGEDELTITVTGTFTVDGIDYVTTSI